MIEKTPVKDLAYVGLDISLTGTGFFLKRGTEIEIKTIKTTPNTAPNDLERLRSIRQSIMELIPAGTAMICVEDFFVPRRASQMGAAKGLIMAGTLIRVALLEKGLPFYTVAPTQLKKFITGKGNSPKSLVVREVYKKLGIDAGDDNQADACVLAHMAEAIHKNQGVGMLKYQEETIAKIIDERPNYNI